jgi:hypothetical protein
MSKAQAPTGTAGALARTRAAGARTFGSGSNAFSRFALPCGRGDRGPREELEWFLGEEFSEEN